MFGVPRFRSLLLFCALLMTACVSCRSNSPQSSVKLQPLAQEIHYTLQWNSLYRKQMDSFSATLGASESKRIRSISQSRPGGIAFPVWIMGPASLKFGTYFDPPQSAEIQASVVIESDYPEAYRREYPVIPGTSQVIDLQPLQDRPARIILQARGANLLRLGGVLHWLDPVVQEQVSSATPEMVASLNAFRARNRERNVIVVLLDAGCRSHFGFAGYARATTPNLDRMARESVVFDNAMTPACYTLASTGSLFTGLYPQVHGVYEKNSALQESFKTLAESLREGGWETGMFSANPNVSPATGYDQGFRHVWDAGVRHRVDAPEIADAFLNWLDSIHNHKFFAYVHFREPHAPYIPPAQFLLNFGGDPSLDLPDLTAISSPDAGMKQQAIAAYDANLAYVDSEVERINRRLKILRLSDNTIIIVLSDHGEAFWEHGTQGHNTQVYDEMIRIPLLLHFPQEPELMGVRRAALAGTIDIFPTLADLFGLSGKGFRHNGRSLLAQICRDPAGTDRLLISHNSMLSSVALRSRRLKFVINHGDEAGQELYRLDTDPLELHNVTSEFPIASWAMHMILQRKLDSLNLQGQRMRGGQERRAVIDEEMREQLHALGYVD